jgi:hypothetical protein
MKLRFRNLGEPQDACASGQVTNPEDLLRESLKLPGVRVEQG